MDKPPPPQPQPPPSNTPSQTLNPPRPLHQQPQPQPQPHQQLFRRQQHAAMARFPSNIDAHLRPLGSLRPFFNPVPVPVPNLNANPNPNPIPAAAIHTPPPTNPNNLGSLLPHIPPSKPIRTPLPPPSDLPRHRPDPIPIPIPPPLPPPRDKAKDDAFFTVSDRKVRISERNDLYALCRSWLRNGYREESQPQYGDSLKSLPKPLHLPEPSSPVKKEIDDETDGEDENAVWTLSAEELLQRHVKRAKRVRERLREERLWRIKRYKSRLKLLLPSPLEQCRGDTAPS